MKKPSTFLLIVSLFLVLVTLDMTWPPVASAAPQPGIHADNNAQPQGTVVCLIIFFIIVVVVAIIIWGLIQMCKKIPQPPPPSNNPQPTNITIWFPPHAHLFPGPGAGPISTINSNQFMQFVFEFGQVAADTNNANGPCYFGGNTNGITDEIGNNYLVFCSFNLLSSTNTAGPWVIMGTVTNWMGGNFTTLSTNAAGTCATFTVTNQETALYDPQGNLLSARRWMVDSSEMTNCIVPRLIIPDPGPHPDRFYRLVLLPMK